MPVLNRDFSNYFDSIKSTAAVKPEAKTKKNYTVENLFKPQFKNGKAEVTMRFLPSNVNEFKPFIENRSHLYEYEEGKWFGCDCLEKYGQTCPICEYNHKLYTCKKFTKDEARPLRLPNPRRRFISNVLIVKNDNAPETEGKVYRFEYGIQIMDMIRNAMQGYDDPEDGHVDGYNPFDYKKGANFFYVGIQGAMGPKLDKSKFGKQRPICDKNGKELTEKEIEVIDKSLYTLDEYEAKAENARSFDEIAKYFMTKTGKYLFEEFKGTPAEVPETAANSTRINATNTTAATVAETVDASSVEAETSESVNVPTSTASTKSEDDYFNSLVV